MRAPGSCALLFLLLILISPSFASYTGHMVAEVEKEWDIQSNGTLREVLLNSSFLLESPYQRVIQMNTSDGELVRQGDEIRLIYSPSTLQAPKTITATATVEVTYLPSLESNPPFQNRSFPGSPLTNCTPVMSAFAKSYTSESEGELDAMASLTSWVHKNVNYDTAFWGMDSPAAEVYSGHGAVCVGFTHLLLSFANSLGVENRYVSGYVFTGPPAEGQASISTSGGWQQHAWAELRIGGQWVPADPTFQEFGYLDARRIASSYSVDQSGAADRLSAKGGPFSFDTVTRIHISESTPFPPIASAYAAYDGTEFNVVLTNPGQKYVTPTYTIIFPPYIHSEDSGIVALPPGGRKILTFYLSTDALGGGSIYRIPYMITMQGTEISDTLTYSRQGGFTVSPGASPNPACPAAFILFFTFLLAAARGRRN